MPKKSGFTLIELLITIIIIAILAAIGLVTYSMALKQGRDSKRQSDLRAIQSALEQYNSDQFFYPRRDPMNTVLWASPPGAFTNVTGCNCSSSVTKTYMNSLPQDPTDPTGVTGRYKYEAIPASCDNSGTKCTNYCLYAKLETLSSPAIPAVCTVTLPAGYNFAVSLP